MEFGTSTRKYTYTERESKVNFSVAIRNDLQYAQILDWMRVRVHPPVWQPVDIKTNKPSLENEMNHYDYLIRLLRRS